MPFVIIINTKFWKTLYSNDILILDGIWAYFKIFMRLTNIDQLLWNKSLYCKIKILFLKAKSAQLHSNALLMYFLYQPSILNKKT